jgi:hypothetical protein
MTNKSSLYALIVTTFFTGFIAKINSAMDKQVPLGYEDETGFHLGLEPDEKADDCPFSW